MRLLVEHHEEAFHCAVDSKLLSIVARSDMLVVAAVSWRGTSARSHHRNQTELTWLMTRHCSAHAVYTPHTIA